MVLDTDNIRIIHWRCTHVNKYKQLKLSDLENIQKVYISDTTTIILKINLRQSRTINHAKIMFYEVQSLLIERFGEDICKLIICINKLKWDITILNMISQEVIPNVYMLGSRMLNRILAKVDGTCIITFDWNVIKFYTIVQQLLFLPQNLWTT